LCRLFETRALSGAPCHDALAPSALLAGHQTPPIANKHDSQLASAPAQCQVPVGAHCSGAERSGCASPAAGRAVLFDGRYCVTALCGDTVCDSTAGLCHSTNQHMWDTKAAPRNCTGWAAAAAPLAPCKLGRGGSNARLNATGAVHIDSCVCNHILSILSIYNPHMTPLSFKLGRCKGWSSADVHPFGGHHATHWAWDEL
jgi:hypothetical protein